MNNKWNQRFLDLAENVAGWSKDPSTKVGAVIVNPDRQIMSCGYNGLPQGVEDTKERLENRELKYSLVVHAERNAIIFARQNLKDCYLYTYPFMPCSVCAGMIIQSGIKHVVSYKNYNPRWADSFDLSIKMFSEAKVELILLEKKLEGEN